MTPATEQQPPEPQPPEPQPPEPQPYPLLPGAAFRDRLLARLLDRRIVLVHGPLDPEPATELAAALLTLDAESGDPVTVRLDCPGGDLGSALMLADTIDLMRAPVLVDCVGEVGGAAVAVVTAGQRRQASPNARFHLVEPRIDPPQPSGTADQIAAHAARHEAMVRQLCTRIAQVTGGDADTVRDQVRGAGTMLTAQEAVAYGLIERIVTPLRPR